jgi:glutamate synthase domain-containing protein 3
LLDPVAEPSPRPGEVALPQRAVGETVSRSALGDRVMRDAWRVVRDGGIVDLEYPIGNGDRTVGARLGGAIARRFGRRHPPGFARIGFRGVAGQSFGAFVTDGVEFRLVGEANDYVGKGMGGGRLVIVPPAGDAGAPVLAGNTVLYGATGGELYVAGAAMNRFAVRNAGATAVVEGVGEHACEYMTGGLVIVLGGAGMNVGAGMTGGEVFLLDDGWIRRRVNLDTVEAVRPDPEAVERLRGSLHRHVALTGSLVARRALATDLRSAFLHVRPREARHAVVDGDDAAVGSGIR